ncbi:hypothetical protein [Roseibium sp.]|uniref:hypothetical protein n=1 Tax=Roseibium sp. TaxID=1936156 RepID=UPI003B515B3E
MKGPLVKQAGRELLREGDLPKIRGPFAQTMIRFNNHMERVPLSPEEMKQFLSFRLDTVWKAKKRSSWLGGRLFNYFAVGDPDYLQMSGARVGEVLALAGYNVPDVLDALTEYHVRRDIVEEAYFRFNKQQVANS